MQIGGVLFWPNLLRLSIFSYIETSRSYLTTRNLLKSAAPQIIITTAVHIARVPEIGLHTLITEEEFHEVEQVAREFLSVKQQTCISKGGEERGHYVKQKNSLTSISNGQVFLNRKMFDDTKGLEILKDVASENSKKMLFHSISQNYLGLAAVSACLQWFESELKFSIARHSLSVLGHFVEKELVVKRENDTNTGLVFPKFQIELGGKEDHLYIQYESALSLGIVNPTLAEEHSGTPSLYSLLSKDMQTKSGCRLLRANLLQPLCDISTINAR